MVTSRQVGFSVWPEVVEITPSSASKGGSTHQKQPPAKVAFASVGASPCRRIGTPYIRSRPRSTVVATLVVSSEPSEVRAMMLAASVALPPIARTIT